MVYEPQGERRHGYGARDLKEEPGADLAALGTGVLLRAPEADAHERGLAVGGGAALGEEDGGGGVQERAAEVPHASADALEGRAGAAVRQQLRARGVEAAGVLQPLQRVPQVSSVHVRHQRRALVSVKAAPAAELVDPLQDGGHADVLVQGAVAEVRGLHGHGFVHLRTRWTRTVGYGRGKQDGGEQGQARMTGGAEANARERGGEGPLKTRPELRERVFEGRGHLRRVHVDEAVQLADDPRVGRRPAEQQAAPVLADQLRGHLAQDGRVLQLQDGADLRGLLLEAVEADTGEVGGGETVSGILQRVARASS